MALYRKKPVVIEAVRTNDILLAYQYGGGRLSELPQWVKDAYEGGVLVGLTNDGLTVKTEEGDMIALQDDILIRGIKGELYPCKPDIFELTYEPADI